MLTDPLRRSALRYQVSTICTAGTCACWPLRLGTGENGPVKGGHRRPRLALDIAVVAMVLGAVVVIGLFLTGTWSNGGSSRQLARPTGRSPSPTTTEAPST